MTKRYKILLAISPLVLTLLFLALFAVLHFWFPPEKSTLQLCTRNSSYTTCLPVILRFFFGVGSPMNMTLSSFIGWLDVFAILCLPILGGLVAAVNVERPLAHFIHGSYDCLSAAAAFYILSFALLFPMLTDFDGWTFILSAPFVLILLGISWTAKSHLTLNDNAIEILDR